MAETIIDKQKCGNCGSDVRDNTQFCYNCGKSTLPDVPAEPESNGATAKKPGESEAKAALDELAAKLSREQANPDNKLAKAAEERKRARVERRRTKDYRWEPIEDTSALRLVLAAGLVALGVLLLVLAALWWK